MHWYVLGVACLATGCSLPRTDVFYVRGAALAERDVLLPDSNPQRTYEEHVVADLFGTRGHRIGSGQAVVFAYRRFSPGNWFAVDDESFEKLTIEIPDSLLSGGTEFGIGPTQPVTVRYSEGASAVPDGTCYGEASAGVLRIQRQGAQFVVTVRATVPPRSPHWWCKDIVIDRRLELRERPLEALTTWLGRAGEHPYAETYP